MKCKICETRRPRRACPGVRGDICALCCGAGREVTVDCPLDCEYLQEARRHERPAALDPHTFPNQDIHLSDQFLRDHEELLMFLSLTLLGAALETSGSIDLDAREALQSLIRTYRTLQSGLYYETRSTNLLAQNIQTRVQERIQEFREAKKKEIGMESIRDAEILGVLVFLERAELQQNNGRQRGRAFIDFLRGFFPEQKQRAEEPRVIL